MHRKPTLYWHEKLIMAYLIQAASIHRRLPEVRPQGYQTLWPTTLKDDWERLYDLLNGRSTLGSPMPPEITFHEEVMTWLRQLDRKQQQLCWMRANRIPWKILVEEFDRSKASLSRDLHTALESLVAHLNRIDPKGDYFRQLRSRANSVAWPCETL